MEDEIKELFPNEFYVKKDKKMYAEISLENLNKIDDCITNLQECCKDKIDRYQDMILKYCELDEKYKKSCETYQQALDETMSEKMDLEKENEDLREDNYAYHQLMKMQNKREFRSKFLKEFQEEFGTNTFPDYDEIYKRYDKIKKENESNINRIHELEEEIDSEYVQKEYYKSRCEKAKEKLESIRILGLRNGKTLFSTLIDETIDILDGDDNELDSNSR